MKRILALLACLLALAVSSVPGQARDSWSTWDCFQELAQAQNDGPVGAGAWHRCLLFAIADSWDDADNPWDDPW